MSFASFFGITSSTNVELPELFPLAIADSKFIQTDVTHIYSKILTDVIERTEGIPEKMMPSLWDNCLQSENSEGLISMLSKAMTDKKELFLTYDPGINLLRKPTNPEEMQIRADYKAKGKSPKGTFVSFRNLDKTDMVKIYSGLEYCAIASLNKNMNLSKAVQLRMSDLRASVASIDSKTVEDQAKAIAKALSNGKDVMIDVKDIIETLKPDLTATEKTMEFINQRRCFYLGMPGSYNVGELKTGLSDTGAADSKAIERGLKAYYFSIIKPVLESVFVIKTSFRSDDMVQLSTALEALKTFELVSDEYMSSENKLKTVNKLFGFPENTKGGEVEEIEPPRDVTPPNEIEPPQEV